MHFAVRRISSITVTLAKYFQLPGTTRVADEKMLIGMQKHETRLLLSFSKGSKISTQVRFENSSSELMFGLWRPRALSQVEEPQS